MNMATATGATAPHAEDLQAQFLSSILPKVRARARAHARHLPESEREDAMAECVAVAWKNTVLMARGDKRPTDYAGPLAHFAVKHVHIGRKVWATGKRRSVSARAAGGEVGAVIMSALTDERRQPDRLVRFALDTGGWMDSLAERSRKIVNGLAEGQRACDLAPSLDMTQSRFCQVRKELAAEYAEFVGLPQPA
jgi:hypothetical protein